MLWGFVAVAGLITYRIRRRGGDEPLLRRIEYALFPGSDPESPRWLGVTTLSFMLVAGGAVMVLVAFAIVAILNR